MSEFIVGGVCGLAIAQMLVIYLMDKERSISKKAAADELHVTIKGVADSHNNLMEFMNQLDRKVVDLGLRTDAMSHKRSSQHIGT